MTELFSDTLLLHLLELTLKTGLLAAAAHALLRLARTRSVAVRFAAWRTVTVLMLVLPVLTVLAPALLVLPALPGAVAVAPSAGHTGVVPASAVPQAADPRRLEATPVETEMPRRSDVRWMPGVFSWQRALAWTYLAGLAAMLGRLVFGLAVSRRLVSRARPIQEPGFLALYEDLARTAGLRRPPEVREAAAVRVPVALGYGRTRVLLPPQWREWDRKKLSSVLAHELAHVRRRDLWTYLACAVNRCVYWFHPLAWSLPRRLASLAEQACDSLAAGWTGDRRRYARHLVEIAGSMTGREGRLAVAAVPMAGGEDLETRVQALCGELTSRAGSRGRVGAVVITLTILTVGSASSVLRLEARQRVDTEVLDDGGPAAERPGEEETMVTTQTGLKTRQTVVVRERKDDPPDEQLAEIRESKEDPRKATKRTAGKSDRRPSPRVSEREARASVRDLSSSDAQTRARAAAVMRKSGLELRDSVEPLTAMLGDHTPVDPAAITLGAVPDRVFEGGTHPGLEAAWALGKMGDLAFEPLAEAARSRDWRVRHDAAIGLGFTQDPRARPSLERLLGDADERVRERAAWGMSMLGDPTSSDRLVTLLSAEDAAVRAEAAHGLGMRQAPEAVGALISALEDPEPDVRAHAAWGLGMVQDVSASSALAGALSDRDGRVREQAAWALGMLQDDQASRTLAAALGDDLWRVRAHAAWALGMGLGGDAVDELIQALSDDRPEVRNKAAWALGRLAAGQAAVALEERLSDDSPEVRAHAAWALGMMKAASARESLERATRDPDPAVRERAGWALRYLDAAGGSGT